MELCLTPGLEYLYYVLIFRKTVLFEIDFFPNPLSKRYIYDLSKIVILKMSAITKETHRSTLGSCFYVQKRSEFWLLFFFFLNVQRKKKNIFVFLDGLNQMLPLMELIPVKKIVKLFKDVLMTYFYLFF